MIYLVTKNQELFENPNYKIITPEESLRMLGNLKVIGFDTETEGLDCHTKALLSLQLGCYDWQVVVDCKTINPLIYKELFESTEHLFLGWNLKFDAKFLYKYKIVPKNLYDGFLAEKLLWLGYPSGLHPLSLKHAAETYIGYEMDKTVRGQIIWKGLCEETIIYAANDVKYLEKIIIKQREALREKGLLTAIDIENRFLLPLSYMEYCGIKVDVKKWKEKMAKDNAREKAAKKACDEWLLKAVNEGITDEIMYVIYKGNTVPLDSIDMSKMAPSEIENIKSRAYPIKSKVDLSEFRKYITIDRQGTLFDYFGNVNENPYDLTPKISINWNSAKQLIPLFKKFGVNVEVDDKEKGGTKDSIDAKVLKPQKAKCSLIPLYLDYREAVKVTSTYGENFLRQINPVSGRIHTNYT